MFAKLEHTESAFFKLFKMEEENFVIHGPELWHAIPEVSLGKQIYESFLDSTDEDIAFIHFITEEEMSYKKLFNISCRLAQSIINCGYDRGDVISVCSENSCNFFVPVVAGLYLGIPVAPINNSFKESEFKHALNIAKPKLVFCSKKMAETFLKLKKTVESVERIIVLETDASVPHLQNLGDFMNENCDSNFNVSEFRPADLNPLESVAAILYSSGTTGMSKGVMITHDNISMRINQMSDPRLTHPNHEICIGLLPFFHVYGFMTTIGAFVKRSTTVLLPRFEENLFLSCIEKYKISQLWLVPTLMIFLAKSPLVSKYDLSSLNELICGAAPLSAKIEAEVRRRLPHVKTIRQGYGITEAIMAVLLMPIREDKTGSVGKIVPGMSCLVRDTETSLPLGPHEVGELCLKGRMVMKGYYGNPEATKNTFTDDEWLVTGDLVYYDEEEYFFVVDRKKELIKYKGFQVAPAELEALLLTYPKIQDAAVIGRPDDVAGELAMAFVVVEASAKLSEDEVKDFVAGRVSKVKHLHGGVRFLTEIPKNPSGKILRRELRDLIKKQGNKLEI